MNKSLRVVVFLGALVAFFVPVVAQASEAEILLELLVKKGLISADEASEVKTELRAEVARSNSYQSASSVSTEPLPGTVQVKQKAVEKLSVYGDLRLRYQYENGVNQGSDNDEDRSRWRYRARLGAEYDFKGPWTAGLRLETSDGSDSTNVDWGGFFNKNSDGVNIGLAYLEYKGDELNVRLGKHKHPFHLPGAIWDGDINPEGISESYQALDMMTLHAGQYIIDDANERTHGHNDDFLFVAQAEVAPMDNLKISPIILYSTRDEIQNSINKSVEDQGVQYLTVLAVPVEYKFKALGLSSKLFGSYGINLDAEDQMELNFGITDEGHHNQFFNIGYQLGSAKKAGEWQASIEYRFLEAASYTSNLVDSDFGKGSLNQKGVVLSGKYAFTDFLFGGITGLISNNIDPELETPSSTKDRVDVIQVDISASF